MLGIISDIHGNYPALQAVLGELDKKGCKDIVSLGDVCGYYCMVNECVEELRERSILNIMGNHDSYIVNNTSCGRSYTVNICLDYQRKILLDKNFEWVKGSVSYYQLVDMWMVHGGWNDYLDEYIDDFSFLDDKSAYKYFISGHTHVQKHVKGKYAEYINPGGVGQPRDYDNRAAYAIIHDNRVELCRVEYDIDKICFEMKKAGFDDRVSDCLFHGCKIGER